MGTWSYAGEWECVFYDKIEQKFWGLAQAGSVAPVKANIGQYSADGMCKISLENIEADRFPSSTILELHGIPTKGRFFPDNVVNNDRTLEIVFYDTRRKKFINSESNKPLTALLTFSPTPTIKIIGQNFDGAWLSGTHFYSPERLLEILGSNSTYLVSNNISLPKKAEIYAAWANYLKLTSRAQRSHFWDSTLAILRQKKYINKRLPNAEMPVNLLKSIGTEFVTNPQKDFPTFEATVQKRDFASNSFGGNSGRQWRGKEVDAKNEVINVLLVVLAKTFNPNLGGARTYKKGKTLLSKSRKTRRAKYANTD